MSKVEEIHRKWTQSDTVDYVTIKVSHNEYVNYVHSHDTNRMVVNWTTDHNAPGNNIEVEIDYSESAPKLKWSIDAFNKYCKESVDYNHAIILASNDLYDIFEEAIRYIYKHPMTPRAITISLDNSMAEFMASLKLEEDKID